MQKKFNEPKSRIYNDAQELQEIFQDGFEKAFAENEDQEPKKKKKKTLQRQ